jgi:tetratricopeptide (TPR) repeat protein
MIHFPGGHMQGAIFFLLLSLLGMPSLAQNASSRQPPQAKTQREFDAWKAASASADPAALEKASGDFATKFPDSELRVLLYKNAMRRYQNANNTEKTEAMGRKVLSFDGDDAEALVIVAEMIAERTRDADIDRDQRFGEAMTMARRAIQTVDYDISIPPGTTREKVDEYSRTLIANAYSVIGTVDFKKNDFATAECDLLRSINTVPKQPDPVVVLRLAISLDKQGKYPEALTQANRAVDLTRENTPVGDPSRQERFRLQQLAPEASSPVKPSFPPSCGDLDTRSHPSAGTSRNTPIQEKPRNTITFDNQSGTGAFVKLVGAASQAVGVPTGQSATVNVAAGDYSVLVRYGASSGEYIYSKGPLKITKTATQHSAVKIMLRRPAKDNADAHKEFDAASVPSAAPTPPMVSGPPNRASVAYLQRPMIFGTSQCEC